MRVITTTISLCLTIGAAWATADGPDFLRVRDVASNDVLSIRAEPAPQSQVISSLGPTARAIRNLGCHETPDLIHYLKTKGLPQSAIDRVKVGEMWCKVEVPGSKNLTGWVNARFVEEDSSARLGAETKPDCRDITYFEVVGVPLSDTLTIRSGPGSNFAKVGELDPREVNIENRMDQEAPAMCASGWRRISKSHTDSSGNFIEISGWASAKYLKPSQFMR